MNKARVTLGIPGTRLCFVYDTDPGAGHMSMLDDAAKRAKAELAANGTQNAMKMFEGQEPDMWLEGVTETKD